MTLQELIGELQTLALAYPDTTPVKVQHANARFLEIPSVSTREEAAEVIIVVEAQ